MKKLSLLFSLLLISFMGQAQSFPVPDSGAVWNINFSGIDIFLPQNPLGSVGDTMINGNLYVKISQSNDTFFDISNSTHFCALRELNQQWLFIPASDTVEYMLYDFGVAVGDTVQITNPWASVSDITITAIDSVLLGGYYRKRITSNNVYLGWYDEYWIEGIGSTNGLFYSVFYIVDSYNELLCFHHNDTLIYMNPIYNDCRYSPTNVSKIADYNISVFPNPFSERLNIESSEFLNEATLTLFNSLGQAVKISTKQSGNTFQLAKEELPAGIYLLQIAVDKSTLPDGFCHR